MIQVHQHAGQGIPLLRDHPEALDDALDERAVGDDPHDGGLNHIDVVDRAARGVLVSGFGLAPERNRDGIRCLTQRRYSD